ncbi:bifunctional phosphopantothenoylcysteine decarboxylase/phosphopantothenate--cysteine ligase CoaBC [Gilvimarinus agarilyticus]|uniref:bifunctional phosphopantothenoylcysteine decarboxylase/phosphopantothenate--cysteine ligase CoaBC n=1 Tax=Gilvimarinus agarilyticus TaxID=679259 RepID=UPI0005A1408A|nr:bifunctional phosphopantothenoylcysteine decarboxylase/phosphopantothenate--cysteine ligase CoaBC [Gilvimarinus agarilyticus]
MSTLQNKRILLGVTGGIAAYKTAELVRELRRTGASVRVVMTMAACEFITPLTLQALSGNPVHTSLLDPEAEAAMGHIELARWADLTLIAPASADFLARLSGGMGDDLLSTICLATRSPIAIAPAMNQAMWDAPSTVANMTRLRQRDFIVLGPGSGEQACGEFGPGRMLEPVELAGHLELLFSTEALTGKTVVITAGPTREAIDPVRYLSNYSSGKMGYALAAAAAEAGARTILISGPCQLAAPERVELVNVVSADDMLQACLEFSPKADLFIGAAAVADFRPATVAEQKLKKSDADTMTLELVKNPDIIAAVAAQGQAPFTVAFAAESEQVLDYARAKLARKKVDCIIANDISAPGIGFNSDDNAVTLIDRRGETRFEQQSKAQLARELISRLAERL